MKRLFTLLTLALMWACTGTEMEPAQPDNKPDTPSVPQVPEIPQVPEEPADTTKPAEPSEPEKPRKVRVGVFGDSISTYEGWLYSTNSNAVWYPTKCTSPISGCEVLTNASQTYWHQLIFSKHDNAELDVNSSWQGTKVVSSNNSFLARHSEFSDPDVILIHGGTNDKNQSSPIGTLDYTLPTEYLNESQFAQAYIKTIKLLVKKYPGVNLILIVGDMLAGTQYATTIKAIASHYNLPCVDFTDVTLKKCQGSHPDVKGHKDMADRIWNQTQQYFKYKDSSRDNRFFSEEVKPEWLEGKGTQAEPYLVKKAEHLEQINSLMVAGSTTYIKLLNDIDMSSVKSWAPYNNVDPYNKAVDFNGNGYSINNFSYSSNGWCGFFAVVNGHVYNLTFKNATINASGSCAGILAAWIGANNGVSAKISNVRIEGGSITMTGKNEVGSICGKSGYDCSLTQCHSTASVTGTQSSATGGLIGKAEYSTTFDRCSYQGNIQGSRYCGGIVAILKSRDNGVSSHIKNCFTSGSISGGQQTGGIAGDVYQGITVSHCWSNATLTGQYSFGGIIGRAANGKSTAADQDYKNTVSACIAWNPQVKTSASSYLTDKYSGAAIVGFTGTKNVLQNCIRRADMTFKDCLQANVLIDQENSSSTKPLATKNTDTLPYNYPYHGKAAASGATLSSVATSLGYDSSIWDLSKDTPSLK